MLIYNITTKVNWNIHEAWLIWMKEKHIPDVMNTGYFSDFRFARLLDIDEEEGPTYSNQYDAHSKEQYEEYILIHAPTLRKEVIDKWSNQIIAFRTLMELVH